MQTNRLFQIVYCLLSKGKCTAPELAERFEVSVRTIYRDLDAISAAGIPIYATQGKGGGHRQCDIFQCCLHIHSRLVVVLYEVRILVKLGLRDRPVFLGLGPVVLAELVVGSLED